LPKTFQINTFRSISLFRNSIIGSRSRDYSIIASTRAADTPLRMNDPVCNKFATRSRFLAATCIVATLNLTSMRSSLAGDTTLTQFNRSASTIIPSTSGEASDRGQTVGYALDPTTQIEHAVVWTGAPSSAIDLNPFGFASSTAIGTDGDQQVGQGMPGNADNQHALLWFGTSISAIDLNPVGFLASTALATDLNEEVGTGTKSNGTYRALLWQGSATSAIDLDPAGFSDSVANGTNGKLQVGEGYGSATGGLQNALLWRRTAASAVNLNPTDIAGVRSSFAMGVAGSQEVGYAVGSNKQHQAVLWHGTASSAVNLNPTGFTFSIATGTNGAEQVGEGYGSATAGVEHALLWSGTADSYIDLGASLPAGTKSFAFSIDAAGDVFGYSESASGTIEPLEWSAAQVGAATPEPAGSALLAVACLTVLRRRRAG
jgi:hypothetical protein